MPALALVNTRKSFSAPFVHVSSSTETHVIPFALSLLSRNKMKERESNSKSKGAVNGVNVHSLKRKEKHTKIVDFMSNERYQFWIWVALFLKFMRLDVNVHHRFP